MTNPVTRDNLVRGGKYNWKGQPDRLEYIGKAGAWYQFVKTSNPGKIWCEVLEEDLRLLEETYERTN
jgi:hypothetical protein